MLTYFIADYQVNGFQNTTVEEAVSYLQQRKIIAIDIETAPKYPKGTYYSEVYEGGLDPYLSTTIMLQIGTSEKLFVIDVRCIDILPFKEIIESKEILKVGQNLKFEAKHLHSHKIRLEHIWDTMLVDIIYNNGLNLKSGLDSLQERYLGIRKIDQNLFVAGQVGMNKDIRSEFLTIGNKPFLKKHIEYGVQDIVVPLQIFDIQQQGKKINGELWKPDALIRLENEFCLVLADIELAGMPFNIERHSALVSKNEQVYNRRKKILDDFLLTVSKFKKEGLFGDHIELEWTSSKQVIEVFKHFGNCPKEISKSTKKEEYTVSATALLKLLPVEYKEYYEKDIEQPITDFNSFTLMYLLFKTAEQAITTFGREFQKNIHPITKRIHSDYWQIVNTGRISSRSPNLQNWPSEEDFRMCFNTIEGRSFVLADYSGQELRITAEKSDEKSMVDFFNDGHPIFGDDFHAYVATNMFRIMRKDKTLVVTKNTHPKERNAAKSLNFKIIYGGTAFSLKFDFDVDLETAEEFIETYFQALPGLKKYFNKVEKEALENGYIKIDILGRRWFSQHYEDAVIYKEQAESYYPKNFKYLPEYEKAEIRENLKKNHPEVFTFWKKYFNIVNKSSRSARNYPIQGTGGSMTKMAAVFYRRWLLENGLRWVCPIVNLVHDEIIVETRKNDVMDAAKEMLKECMIKAGKYFCKAVKIETSSVVADYWKH